MAQAKVRKIRRGRYSPLEKRDFPFVYLLILIPVVQFLIFWVYVNFDSIILAFQDDATGAFTVDHFIEVGRGFSDTDPYGFNLWQLIGRSILLWCVQYLIIFPVSLVTTYALYRKVAGHYVFRVIFLIPALIGGVIWIGLMKSMADWNGVWVYLLESMGVDLPFAVEEQGLFASDQTAFPTLIFIQILFGIAGGNVVVTGAYAKTPNDLFDAGRVDGLGFWGSFLHISLPVAWPTITSLYTISLCQFFVFDVSVFLYSETGAHGMATMGYYLYWLTYYISNTTSVNKPYGYPAALGLVVTLISIPVVLIGRKLLGLFSDAEV